MRRILLAVFTVALVGLGATAVLATREARPDPETFAQPLDGPRFRPADETTSFEVVSIPDEATLNPGDLVGDHHCSNAPDQSRCRELLLEAVHEVASVDRGQRLVDYIAAPECVMCDPVMRTYLFVVGPDSSTGMRRNAAVRLLGPIDAPGEAWLIAGGLGAVREVDGGFEVLTESRRCDADGPRYTVKRVSTDGSVEIVWDWFEGLGYTCDDV